MNGLAKALRWRRRSARDVKRRLLDSQDVNPDGVLVAFGDRRSIIVMMFAIVQLEVSMNEGFRMVIVGLVDMLPRSECRKHKTRNNEETSSQSPETQHEG